MATRRGCSFVPITVTCTKEENLRRLISSDRLLHGKLTDTEVVAHLRDVAVVYQWPKDDQFHIQLDITDLDVDTAARTIFEHVLKVCDELLKM